MKKIKKTANSLAKKTKDDIFFAESSALEKIRKETSRKKKAVKKSAPKKKIIIPSIAIKSKKKEVATPIFAIDDSKLKQKISSVDFSAKNVKSGKDNLWRRLSGRYTFKVSVCKNNECRPISMWCEQWGLSASRFNLLIAVLIMIFAVDLFLFSFSAGIASQQRVAVSTVDGGNLINKELENQYREAVMQIFAQKTSYASPAQFTQNGPNESVRMQNELLALKVPSYYKSLHLNLIIALSLMEQGIQGDAEKLRTGGDVLAKIKMQYPWVKP